MFPLLNVLLFFLFLFSLHMQLNIYFIQQAVDYDNFYIMQTENCNHKKSLVITKPS